MDSNSIVTTVSSPIKGQSEMATLTRQKDWSKTSIGNIGTWPQPLLTMVNVLLNSKFPMLLMWGPDWIQFYNDAYRPSLGANGKHPAVLGSPARDTWGEIWHIIEPLIRNVYDTQEPFWTEDQLVPIYRNGQIEEAFWTFSYSPVFDESGSCAGVLATCIETTSKVKNTLTLIETKSALENAQLATKRERDRLHAFFMEAPAGICILSGPDYVYEFVNPAYQQLVPGRDLIGKPLFTALPELKNQPLENILNHVFSSGETYEGKELMLNVSKVVGEDPEEMYFNFIYQPRRDAEMKVDGIMVFIYDVTEMAKIKIALQESELKFRSIVQQSPVPVLLTSGENLMIKEINEPMLKLLKRDQSVKEKPALEVMPELIGQPILEHLFSCLNTGIEWSGFEQPISIVKEGKVELGYYNLTYKPFFENGKVTGVLHAAFEVTEQVLSKQQLQNAQDTLRLSLLAANLGTFDFDVKNGRLHWDNRCRTLFGITHANDVSYEIDFVGGLHPDDRDRIINTINGYTFNKSASNGHYDVEYRTCSKGDNKTRWIRAMGKAYFDQNEKPIRFIGTVLDITEQKEDELRKNDFIGMASHELKTPLTSITGYIQILQTDRSKELAPVLLPKIEAQLKKMKDMINGFLTLSRFESGKLVLDKQLFDIGKLIDEIVSSKKVVSPNHTFIVNECSNVGIFADKDKIESVIKNLLDNAVKYSAINSTVRITCQETSNSVTVRVTDDGLGIRQEDIENIFQRFYRVEDEATKTISGFGIGLYLSSEIIKRHGGTIHVESIHGKGSQFYFTLPKNVS